VVRIARSTAEAIGVGRPLGDDDITVLDGYAGPAHAGFPGRGSPERELTTHG